MKIINILKLIKKTCQIFKKTVEYTNNRNLAQLVERLPYTQNVIGSTPVVPTKTPYGLNLILSPQVGGLSDGDNCGAS